ncbi:HepT-like ribonuclease domain-containing protein [Agromyces neolithicus]|uniref:DUF86 domain-containing protein n=1 Tax=Agromyces neolithicus TaxID=269420 RepID=A0ABN2M8H3_9MICO
MSDDRHDRIDRWIDDLDATLVRAESLVARGQDEYRSDPALPLAFEALSSRVGELAKRLTAAQPERFDDQIWSQAARNRDFVVHHYDRIDHEALWLTVAVAFPRLRTTLNELRH